jgi:ketosteroid isomerase-like protein
MSQENVRLFREAIDAFNRRDRATWLALCDPEYENLPPRDWPEARSIRGREAIWDFFVAAQEPWDEGSFELGEVIDAGDDTLVAEQRAEMRGKASGAGVAWNYWHVITMRDGKAVRSEWFRDRTEALEAAGVSE